MINLILSLENILLSLNNTDDLLLILAIKDKINILKYSKFNLNYPISQIDKSNALVGLRKTLTKNMYKEIRGLPFYEKIDEILKNNACDNCKYSIEKQGEGFKRISTFNTHDDTARCRRCRKRCSLLESKMDDVSDFLDFAEEKILTDEVINVKSMINKVLAKLKKI